MITADVGIIGGGIVGASVALHAVRQGATVVLLDDGPLPNPRGASIDHSKVFRYAYPDPFYVRLAVAAHALWKELEHDAGRPLLVDTGLILFDPGNAATACFDALGRERCDAVRLNAAETGERWPQFSANAFEHAVFDPSGAMTRAEDAVRATLELARRAGVTFVERDRVVALTAHGLTTRSGAQIACGKVVVAAGPWTAKLRPELAPHLRVTRQEVLYFEPHDPDEFAPGRFPIFLDFASGFYGFPVHHGRAMKLANHAKGPGADPDVVDPAIVDEPAARKFLHRFLPGLADARLVECRVCYYDNTPDDDFIIDWLPGRTDVLLATGFSGHGFKFGPLLGRIVAELLHSGKSSVPLERFALGRFGV